MKNKPMFVIDTNVLLVSISSESQYHWIFQALINQKFELSVTNEILSEYEEIISTKYSPSVSHNVTRTILLLPNTIQTVVYYNWNLIQEDHDDNKFVDCAVASNADAIVTHDKHFYILESISFPCVKVINVSELKNILCS
jgi:uncharacterized protein